MQHYFPIIQGSAQPHKLRKLPEKPHLVSLYRNNPRTRAQDAQAL